jgi:2-C-methyl-D-erythritol 4-phosphate cytidylyltransferase
MSGSPSPPRIGIVIAAGGTGSRFGRPEGKQLTVIAGKPVVAWSLQAVAAVRGVEAIVLVCHPERLEEFRECAARALDLPLAVDVIAGGGTRQASVAAGLAALPETCEVVVVHDGARPLATTALVEEAVAVLLGDANAQGVVVGHPSVDTLKHVDDQGRVTATPDRTLFWAVQTPQVFRGAAIRRAYEVAGEGGYPGTDDASLVERLGGRVLVVEGPRDNLKVTHAEDLLIAEAILTARMHTAEEGE